MEGKRKASQRRLRASHVGRLLQVSFCRHCATQASLFFAAHRGDPSRRIHHFLVVRTRDVIRMQEGKHRVLPRESPPVAPSRIGNWIESWTVLPDDSRGGGNFQERERKNSPGKFERATVRPTGTTIYARLVHVSNLFSHAGTRAIILPSIVWKSRDAAARYLLEIF